MAASPPRLLAKWLLSRKHRVPLHTKGRLLSGLSEAHNMKSDTHCAGGCHYEDELWTKLPRCDVSAREDSGFPSTRNVYSPLGDSEWLLNGKLSKSRNESMRKEWVCFHLRIWGRSPCLLVHSRWGPNFQLNTENNRRFTPQHIIISSDICIEPKDICSLAVRSERSKEMVKKPM